MGTSANARVMSGGGNVTNVYAFLASVGNLESTKTISIADSFRAEPPTYTGAITTWNGFHVVASTTAAGTTKRGLYIENISGATNNYSIYTNTGDIRLMSTPATDKLGFWGATPIVRPSAYTQTYSTADKTHADFTSADIGAFTGGAIGFLDAAERDNVRTQFNALRADVADVKQLVNSLIDDLQNLGLVG
jgi:hypothetical protein